MSKAVYIKAFKCIFILDLNLDRKKRHARHAAGDRILGNCISQQVKKTSILFHTKMDPLHEINILC